MAIDTARLERMLNSLVAASRGDYEQPIPLEETDDELLEVELGVNYLLEELVARRDQNEAQRQALIEQSQQIAAQTTALVEALSTPIIAVWPGVLALPLIGRIDSQRATNINVALLARVVDEGATHVILDLTGVETIETSMVNALLQMIRAIGLLGSSCLVTGISPRGALQLVQCSDEATKIRTYARLSDALARVLADKRALR